MTSAVFNQSPVVPTISSQPFAGCFAAVQNVGNSAIFNQSPVVPTISSQPFAGCLAAGLPTLVQKCLEQSLEQISPIATTCSQFQAEALKLTETMSASCAVIEASFHLNIEACRTENAGDAIRFQKAVIATHLVYLFLAINAFQKAYSDFSGHDT